MILILDIFTFIFGLCVGSFLNCLIYRLEQKKKITGRSFCPHCKHTLNWQDLFPILSFLFLRGKCRYCKKKISIQYPLVELATGILFVLILSFREVGLHLGSPTSFLNLVFLFYVAGALIVIFVYDLKHYLIPDKVLLPAIIITFIFRILEILNLGFVSDRTLRGEPSGSIGFRISDFKNLFSYLIAVIIAAGFFLFIFLISRGKWMGFGDVKLAVLMGLLLGFPNVLVALFLAFFFGAIIGVILMVLQKKGLKSKIPFGPFLIAGTFIALFWGSEIINWYMNLFII